MQVTRTPGSLKAPGPSVVVVRCASHSGPRATHFFLFFFFFNLFRVTPEVYGGSQARSQIEAIAASLHHSHSNSATYTAAHSKAESLSKARN